MSALPIPNSLNRTQSQNALAKAMQIAKKFSCDSSLVLKKTFSSPAVVSSDPKLVPLNNNPRSKSIYKRQADRTVLYVILFIIAFLFVLLLVDLRHSIERERHQLQIKRKNCYEQYIVNECEQAFDAIKDKCNQLKICFNLKDQHEIRITQIVFRLVGRAVHSLVSELTIVGVLIFLALIIIILVYTYKSSRGSLLLKQE